MRSGSQQEEDEVVFQAGKQKKLIPGWFWNLFVCLPLGIMIWWFLRWFFLPSYKRTSALEIETPRSDGIPLSIIKDNFTILKGVGPKTADGLYRAAIFTFEQLALMDPERLVHLLTDQGLPSNNAAFWQEQSKLAAAADWDGLKKLQN